VRRERAAEFMRLCHDALKFFSAVSTYALIQIFDLGASESLTVLAISSVRLTYEFNKLSRLFPIPLPRSVILINVL